MIRLFRWLVKSGGDSPDKTGELQIPSVVQCGVEGSKYTYPCNACEMALNMREKFVDFCLDFFSQDHLLSSITFEEYVTETV